MKRPTLPSTIRIGPYDIKITSLDPLEAAGLSLQGLCAVRTLTISLDPNMIIEQEFQTLLHEINHMIIRLYNITLNIENEEHTVDTFALAWIQIYRDNPLLLTYIQKVSRGL